MPPAEAHQESSSLSLPASGVVRDYATLRSALAVSLLCVTSPFYEVTAPSGLQLTFDLLLPCVMACV